MIFHTLRIPSVAVLSACLRRKFLLAFTMMAVASTFGMMTGCGESEGEEEGGPLMRPGENCMSCHAFTIAGTVYKSANAAAAEGLQNATITVIDAVGKTLTMTSNAAGNYYTSEAVTKPISVSIKSGTTTTKMNQTVATGACSSCHRQQGQQGAPGRVFISP